MENQKFSRGRAVFLNRYSSEWLVDDPKPSELLECANVRLEYEHNEGSVRS